MKIFGVPFSVHTRKVIVAAKLKSIPYEVVPVAPVMPDTIPANWRSLSPTGLIPAIDDGGFTLGDSTAIVVYLERRAPAPALLPREPRDEARALALDAWAGTELFREGLRPIFQNQIVAPRIRKIDGDRAAIEAGLARVGEALDHLERLAPQRWLVGAALSIADLAIVSNLLLLHYLGQRLGRHPKLNAYFRAQLDAPVWAAALAEERPFVERVGLDRSFLE